MTFDFKYRIGDHLFFQGKDALCSPCCKGFTGDRIYQGKVVGRSIEQSDVAPYEILPVVKTNENYRLLIGKERQEVVVPANALVFTAGELTSLTITRIDDPLT